MFMSHPYLVSLPFYTIPIFPLLFFLFTCINKSIDAKRQHVCKQHKQPLGITDSGFRLHDLIVISMVWAVPGIAKPHE